MDENTQNLTFDLHLVFAGMCLLVRDEVRSDNRKMLHVLLPGGSEDMEHHEARLFVDNRYVFGSGGPKGMYEVVLDGALLDLTTLVPNSNADLTKMHDVVDMSCIPAGPVPRRFFETAAPGGLVKARLSLAAGYAKQSNPGGRWNLGNCAPGKQLATWIEWVIPGLPRAPFSLSFSELNLSGVSGLLPLRPLGNKLELFVFHSKPDDRPKPPLGVPLPTPNTRPRPGTMAVHFKGFYPLMRATATTDGPVYVGEEGATGESNEAGHADAVGDSGHTTHRKAGQANFGIDFTCVAATAPAEPQP
jgi:hypothetical protein